MVCVGVCVCVCVCGECEVADFLVLRVLNLLDIVH